MNYLYTLEMREYFSTLFTSIEKIKDDIVVVVVANIKENTTGSADYKSFSVKTEFFNESELEGLIDAFRTHGFYVLVYTDEIAFINAAISGEINKHNKRFSVVYNTAQRGTGPGRKSLIPAFCNMMKIPTTGSNAYVVSLCRNKFHYNVLLKYYGLQRLNFWLFHNSFGWINEQEPPAGIKVMLKPIYESSSIGVDNDSIRTYGPMTLEKLYEMTIRLEQPVIAQEFIEGYEAEVPVININSKITSFGPVGISLNNNAYLGKEILTYDIVYDDKYSFCELPELTETIRSAMRECSEKCIKTLGIEGFGRVDFRINRNGEFFITDIATSPHITRHSSYNYMFQQLNFDYAYLPLLLICSSAKKLGWI